MLLHCNSINIFSKMQPTNQLKAMPQDGIAGIGADKAELSERIPIRMPQHPKNPE